MFDKRALAISLAISVTGGAAYAAPVEMLPLSARTLAQGGAGVAAVNGATSMAINPAGMGFSEFNARDTGEFVLIGATSYENTGLGSDDDGGVFWAKRYTKWAFGLGLYDTHNIRVSFKEPSQGTEEAAILQSYDISANVAYAPSDSAKIGGTLKIISVKEKDVSDKVRQETSGYGLQLGANYRLLDKPIDFTSSSGYLAWDVGAAYHFESTHTPFENDFNHPLRNREITAYPESVSVGSKMSLGWIFSEVSFQLNLNADFEKLKYSGMSDLLFQTSDSLDIELTKKKLGAELLIGGATSSNTFAIRAGITDQTGNYSDLADEQRASVGLGFVRGGFSVDFAAQQFFGASENKFKIGMLEIGIEF
ncbi:OmpP1/FadL family transporter [Oleiphilus sp. HI0117]|nr:hypothetical protein [Oleiphilus sp. HI0117]